MQAVTPAQRWSQPLLRVALALALVVVFASSYLRLRGNGLGCEPWPGCYGTAQALEQAGRDTVAQTLRLAHRVAASLFLLVALAAVMLGWRNWHRAQRVSAAVLLGVTFALAAIGRFTPSTLPWITWANVLGGFALIVLGLGLSFAPDATAGRSARRGWVVALLALLVLQVLCGTLLSVRLTAAECAPACAHAAGGDLLALWQPARAGDAAFLGGAGSAALLQGLHRLSGIVLALFAFGVASLLTGWRARLATFAAVAVLGLGFVATHASSAAIGAAHAIAAACLIAALWPRSAPPR